MGLGLVHKEGFEAGDGALQKCWAIHPEEIIIAALFTYLSFSSSLNLARDIIPKAIGMNPTAA